MHRWRKQNYCCLIKVGWSLNVFAPFRWIDKSWHGKSRWGRRPRGPRKRWSEDFSSCRTRRGWPTRLWYECLPWDKIKHINSAYWNKPNLLNKKRQRNKQQSAVSKRTSAVFLQCYSVQPVNQLLTLNPFVSSGLRRLLTCWQRKPRSPRRRPSCWHTKLQRLSRSGRGWRSLPWKPRRRRGWWSKRWGRRSSWPLNWWNSLRGGSTALQLICH